MHTHWILGIKIWSIFQDSPCAGCRSRCYCLWKWTILLLTVCWHKIGLIGYCATVILFWRQCMKNGIFSRKKRCLFLRFLHFLLRAKLCLLKTPSFNLCTWFPQSLLKVWTLSRETACWQCCERGQYRHLFVWFTPCASVAKELVWLQGERNSPRPLRTEQAHCQA